MTIAAETRLYTLAQLLVNRGLSNAERSELEHLWHTKYEVLAA